MRRALPTICAVTSAALTATTHAGTITAIGPFSGAISESWQRFENYMFNPDFYEQSPATIFGGQATITSPLMLVYEPGFADFGLGSSGIEAQVADGTKAMGLNDADQTATIDFVTPVTEFGAWWAATTGGMFPDPNTISVTFFDTSGGLIETVIIQYSHSARFDGVLDWHGWSSAVPIGSIVYRGDYVAIDALEANEVICESDLDGDGSVGVVDLLDLLAAWGPNPGHPADLDGDGDVGVTDLLQVLAEWGACT